MGYVKVLYSAVMVELAVRFLIMKKKRKDQGSSVVLLTMKKNGRTKEVGVGFSFLRSSELHGEMFLWAVGPSWSSAVPGRGVVSMSNIQQGMSNIQGVGLIGCML